MTKYEMSGISKLFEGVRAMEAEYKKDHLGDSADTSRSYKIYEEAILAELYAAAQRVKPDATQVAIIYKLILLVEPGETIDVAEQDQIYCLQISFLETLRANQIIIDFKESTEEVRSDSGFSTNILCGLIEFRPDLILKYVADEKFKNVPVDLDQESGVLRIGTANYKFRKGDYQFKLVQFLYLNPNQMHSYKDIAQAIGISRKDKSPSYEELRDRQNTNSVAHKLTINNLIDEIRGHFGLKDGKDHIFICNDGYMMRR